MNWDYKVDIWNVAMMAWDIVCGHTLFNGRNHDNVFDDRVHVAEMIAILGPPPFEFRNEARSVLYFGTTMADGKTLNQFRILPSKA
ncbi:hypothetical protein V6Z92_003621 [Aspergillus fumigatus]